MPLRDDSIIDGQLIADARVFAWFGGERFKPAPLRGADGVGDGSESQPAGNDRRHQESSSG